MGHHSTLRRVASTVFRRKRVIASVFAGYVLVAVAYLLTATPKYESVAQVVVRFGEHSIPDVQRGQSREVTTSDRHEIVSTNADILQTHDLARETIEAFGLERVYPDIAANPPAVGTPMDVGVRQFGKNLSATTGMQDNVITVSVLHPDKELAPQLVQKLIELYIAHQTLVYQNPEASSLNDEVRRAHERLASAQSDMQNFKIKWHINDIDQEVGDLLKQRGDADTSLTNSEAALAQAQLRQENLRNLLAGVPQDLPASPGGDKYRAVDDVQGRLADLRAKESQMLANYGPSYPPLAQVGAAISALSHALQARSQESSVRLAPNPNSVYQALQTDMLRATAEARSGTEPVRVLRAQLASIDRRLADLNEQKAAYLNLSRAQQIAEETYRSLSARFEDARVKESLNAKGLSPAFVISAPTKPYRPARPKKLIILVVSAVGGMITAFAAAFFLDAMDDRFVTPEGLGTTLQLPVLASFGPSRRQRGRGTGTLMIGRPPLFISASRA